MDWGILRLVAEGQAQSAAQERGQKSSTISTSYCPNFNYSFTTDLTATAISSPRSIHTKDSLQGLFLTCQQQQCAGEFDQIGTQISKVGGGSHKPGARDLDDASFHMQASTGSIVVEGEATEPEAELEYLGGFLLVRVCLVIGLMTFLVFADASILSTAAPVITNEFRSLRDIGWYSSAYMMGNAVMLPLAGRIFTRMSTRWSYLGFLFVFTLGSLLCGVASSSAGLIAGRAIAGLGSSGLFNGGRAIISGAVDKKRRTMISSAIILGRYPRIPHILQCFMRGLVQEEEKIVGLQMLGSVHERNAG